MRKINDFLKENIENIFSIDEVNLIVNYLIEKYQEIIEMFNKIEVKSKINQNLISQRINPSIYTFYTQYLSPFIEDLIHLKEIQKEISEIQNNSSLNEDEKEEFLLLYNDDLKTNLIRILSIIYQFNINDDLLENEVSNNYSIQNYDKYPTHLIIKIGMGGYESYLWNKMLTEMYLKFLDKLNIKHDLIEIQSNEYGYRYVHINIQENYSYGLFKIENGTHRLIEISPFSKKRQTTLGIVEVIPDIPMNEIKINKDEIRIDTFRASGHGGQYVNKTESAVRITHIPTGIVVSIQTERSQLKNRELAMKILYWKLQDYYRKEHQENLEKITEKSYGYMGEQIRTYTLHPYKVVKDNRIKINELNNFNPDKILSGDEYEFLKILILSNLFKRVEDTLNSSKIKEFVKRNLLKEEKKDGDNNEN